MVGWRVKNSVKLSNMQQRPLKQFHETQENVSWNLVLPSFRR